MKKGILILSVVFSIQSFGWGELGHKASAEISYKFLTPKAKQMLVEILGPNTHVTGSNFPDDVRSDKRFDMLKPYHYMDFPYGKDIVQVLEENKSKKTADSFIAHPELLYGKFSRNQKMLSIQYLIHIIGDMHQPLHVGNGTDMGGNLCSVKWTDPETGKVIDANLHNVWDEKIFDIARKNFKIAKCQKDPANKITYYDYNEIVACVMNDYEAMNPTEKEEVAALGKEPRAKWYEEGQKLHADVYPDEARLYCKTVNGPGSFDPSKVPTLDEAYAKRAFQIGKRRLLLAGLRLAKYLNDAAELYPNLVVPEKDALDSLLRSVEPEKLTGRGTISANQKRKNAPR